MSGSHKGQIWMQGKNLGLFKNKLISFTKITWHQKSNHQTTDRNQYAGLCSICYRVLLVAHPSLKTLKSRDSELPEVFCRTCVKLILFPMWWSNSFAKFRRIFIRMFIFLKPVENEYSQKLNNDINKAIKTEKVLPSREMTD